jgi:hypothetical protein
LVCRRQPVLGLQCLLSRMQRQVGPVHCMLQRPDSQVNGTCIVAEIPPGAITLVTANFQPSSISAALTFSELVSELTPASVQAALFSGTVETLRLKMIDSAPASYLADLGTPDQISRPSQDCRQADTLRFDLVIDGSQAKDLILVLAFRQTERHRRRRRQEQRLSRRTSPSCENVTVVSTDFDKALADQEPGLDGRQSLHHLDPHGLVGTAGLRHDEDLPEPRLLRVPRHPVTSQLRGLPSDAHVERFSTSCPTSASSWWRTMWLLEKGKVLGVRNTS